MSTAVAAAAPAPLPTERRATGGRTRITERALERVAAAVAGEELGVAAKRVDTRLTDAQGALDLAVHAPVRVISIARLRADPRALARSGGSILDRCARAEAVIRDRVQELTGHTVHRVAVRLTDVDVQQERRVR